MSKTKQTTIVLDGGKRVKSDKMEPIVMKHRRTTLERAEKFISPLYFTDVNLRGRLYTKKQSVKSIKHWPAPQGRYIPFEEAIKGDYSDVEVGQSYGPTWATHWFIVTVDLPVDWTGCEAHLRWNSGSEALVWLEGQPVQGLSAEFERLDFPLTDCVQPEHLSFTVYIEMACNGLFGAGDNGMIEPADPNKYFTLSCCEAVVFDRQVYDLLRDVEMLHDVAKHLPEGSDRGYQALYTVNAMVNACDVEDKTTFQRCHDIAKKFFNQKNGDSQHTIHAMGHAHMDTAWLWPYAETIRKCARSWSCTLRLMEKYPDFTFTCSQAQQYEWVKERYPGLYAEIKKYVKEGRFLPVGGTWVEMDGNVPSGEAFVRQFLYGQRFFKKEFGITCKEFWLPDTFGYSAQLPQIMRHCGITRFLTQKLSWNLFNKFPHHTFWWEGIDGSSVLAHFPPGDNYGMEGKVEEILKTGNNFKDKGRSDKSCFLFGFGDGGNGPSEDMLERLKRVKDVDGLPRVKMSTPDEFFSKVEEEDARKLCRWAGELYLELHNGTYTTHAKVKKMNRKCEFLLQNVEFLSSVALLSGSSQNFQYPQNELTRLWKLLLLNQFHDVLPGSSITIVYEDAHRYYNEIVSSTLQLRKSAVEAIIGAKDKVSEVAWNTLGWERSEVVAIDTQGQTSTSDGQAQIDSKGNKLVHVSLPSYGYSVVAPAKESPCVQVTEQSGNLVMENDLLSAHIDNCGRVVKLSVKGQENLIDATYPANQFVIFDDIPLYWDAWDVMDYHLETRKPVLNVIQTATIVDRGPLRATVQFKLKISDKSEVTQTIVLDAGCPYLKFETEVTWHENHKFLKVEFPTSIHTRHVTYEIQHGHLQRPNHYNTSWDSARFEVCGHKWADISEYGRGLAVLNDSKYGFSAINNILRLSLLRAPKAPDNKADIETHTFTYALMPYKGSFQEAGVIQAAYNLNNPVFVHQQSIGSLSSRGFFSLNSQQVVLDTVKKAEDHDNCLVLRLYESFGGQCETSLTTEFPFKSVKQCNGLEEVVGDEPDIGLEVHTATKSVSFKVKPFQIVSLMMEL